MLVKKGQIMTTYVQKDINFGLLPETAFKEKCIENSLERDESLFSYAMEYLYVIPKKDDENISDVSKAFRSISKMTGLRYFSLNRNKEDVLYKACYFVESPDSKKKIADQNEGSADGKTCYVFQHDTSFGKCVYEFNFHENENTFCVNFHNLNYLGVGPFRAVAPEKMRLNVIVADCGDSFLLYLNTNVNCSKLPGIENYLNNSLISRMNALEKWLENSL